MTRAPTPAGPTREARVYVVSDSTGETGHAIARAALARFEGCRPDVRISVFVRSEADLDAALARLPAEPGVVFHTLADPRLRDRLERAAAEIGVPAVGVLDHPLTALARHLGREPRDEAGMQYRLDERYFQRVAALDFAIALDDGALGERLKGADVILSGVSRTSKTPTCIYLGYRGIKAANMPLVPGRPVSPAFEEALASGGCAIGLSASPGRLEQVRRHRLETLGDRAPDYADPERIRSEVADARLFFERHRMPVIDVTRRSIEETAAAVQALLDAHRKARA
ncbi:MAG: pyruvate, water dikinase regulatory protein [Paracoccaceae bacterium]